MIDTHCHLFLPEFDTDREVIIQKSLESGIEKMINPNVDSDTLLALHSLSEQFSGHILPAYGLHPCSVKSDYREQLSRIKEFARQCPMVAIGEIGIDMHWDTTYIKEQEHALEIQFQWAVALDLPVIIHTRKSFEITWEIVKNFPTLKGVFHAFTGTINQAMQVIERGFYVGIGGIVTFKNSGLDRVVSDIPIEGILLETDAPYLAPTPYRGKRNEPVYLRLIAEKIAQIKNLTFYEVEKVTTHNAKQLFKL
ncbi:MAG: TatD family hydrolase [Bacteroidales bacterium]